jgi:hypothetical protein
MHIFERDVIYECALNATHKYFRMLEVGDSAATFLEQHNRLCDLLVADGRIDGVAEHDDQAAGHQMLVCKHLRHDDARYAHQV